MAKNGHSKFFLTIFPKKTGINSEWPKICIPNLLKPFGTKRLEKIWNGQKWEFWVYLNLSSAKRLEEIRNGQN